MPIAIKMPALSPTMTQGHLIVWHKKINDTIHTGDLLLEIETDKAVMEVEATQSGILDYVAVPAGTNDVSVGTIIAVLRLTTEKEGDGKIWLQEQGHDVLPVVTPASAPAPVADPLLPDWVDVSPSAMPTMSTMPAVPTSGKFQANQPMGATTQTTSDPSSPGRDRILVSPLARQWANHHGIDLTAVQGTGPRGRIVKDDIQQAMLHPPRNPNSRGHSPEHPASDRPVSMAVDSTQSIPESVRVPLSGMRKTIAQRLTLSKQTVPHFSLTIECAMDALLQLRSGMNGAKKDLSVNDFMVRACAMALRAVPAMRLMWGDETHALQVDTVDLAVAVSIAGGLITPIVRCADTLPLRSLAVELKSLIARARQGQLAPTEYQGGLFTISNLGMMGIDQFNPIINPPHTGILAIGATKKRPILDAHGAWMVGQTMMATIAADHRTIDGSVAAEFLTTFQKLIENPLLLVS